MGFLLHQLWTQWRFRLILSGLQRVHGNTNETCSWPVSTDGSRHRARSYNVDGVNLGARLDRADEPRRRFYPKSLRDEWGCLAFRERLLEEDVPLLSESLLLWSRCTFLKLFHMEHPSFFSPPPLFLYHILSHFFTRSYSQFTESMKFLTNYWVIGLSQCLEPTPCRDMNKRCMVY